MPKYHIEILAEIDNDNSASTLSSVIGGLSYADKVITVNIWKEEECEPVTMEEE